ncbi:MAG: DUF692 family multinuclear iron-containing protein, partial [Anaerolineales bacterium]
DSEADAPVQWEKIERLMTLTDTPLINIHLDPHARHHPDLDPRDTSPQTCRRLTQRLIADVSAAVERFGPERIIVENDTGGGKTLDACTLPEVIQAVVEATGCGFLLDLSHARIVARQRGLDEKAYLTQLPTHRLRELHLTGIQWLDDAWQRKIAASGLVPPHKLPRYRDRWMDHLPFTDADWDMTTWALAQIRVGAWSMPWVAACEYGGIGGFFEATLDETVLRAQIPRLYNAIHNA